MQPHVIQSAPIRRALVWSALAHAAVALVGWLALDREPRAEPELVDIEVAPPPPKAEALPAEVAPPPEPLARQAAEDGEPVAPPPEPPGDYAVDAGIDAPIDAPPDAAIDAPLPPAPDAAVDAGVPMVAMADAAEAVDGGAVAAADAGALDDAAQIASIVDPWQPAEPPAAGSGGGSGGAGSGAAGGGSGSGSGSAIAAAGSGSAGSGAAVAGMTDEPAVEGAPTSPGTAANLLAYFPKGHTTTVLIRFDRLRGTEWAAPTERLLRPMPDYRVLFGATDAKVAEKLDTIVISTPQANNALATTLVARTGLDRASLRGFLAAVNPVSWSAAKGGLLGKRGGRIIPQDKRVYLSPFKGWFLLAQPGDLQGLTAPAPGNLDTVEATGQLPPWVAGIRAIESQTGSTTGPALVLTIALDGKRRDLGENDFGLGVKSFPTPDRGSLAAEVVKQGWLVRGNMSFASDAAAAEFVAAAEAARQRITDSRLLQAAIGKPAARVIANLSFARTGPRVSYATSISIADMRAIMSAAAQQLDTYFAGLRGQPPPQPPQAPRSRP